MEVIPVKHLREVLDEKNYKKLIAEFGGKRIWIPKRGNYGFRDKQFLVHRNAAIKKFSKQGKTAQELAELFNISLKRVYAVIKTDNGSRPSRVSYSAESDSKPVEYYFR